MRHVLTMLASVALTLLAVTLFGPRVAEAQAGIALTASGDWKTDGSTDVQNLFPLGTPGPGIVTVGNEGPGDVEVDVYDAAGEKVGGGDVKAGGTAPSFTVPAGGRVTVKGKSGKPAHGTYAGSFAVAPAKPGARQ